jgi:hypothetical protein
LFSSAVGSLNPAATSGIRSRTSSQFITASPYPVSATAQNEQCLAL